MGEWLVHLTRLLYATDDWQSIPGEEAKDDLKGKVETVLTEKEEQPGNVYLLVSLDAHLLSAHQMPRSEDQ